MLAAELITFVFFYFHPADFPAKDKLPLNPEVHQAGYLLAAMLFGFSSNVLICVFIRNLIAFLGEKISYRAVFSVYFSVNAIYWVMIPLLTAAVLLRQESFYELTGLGLSLWRMILVLLGIRELSGMTIIKILPVGPIEAKTCLSAPTTLRVSAAAASFNSAARSASRKWASLSRVPPKLFVRMMSAPAESPE